MDSERTNGDASRDCDMLAKELDCVYRVDEILQDKSTSVPEGVQQLVDAIPAGFDVPEACRVRIRLWNFAKTTGGAPFPEGDVLYRAPLAVGGESVGELEMANLADGRGGRPELRGGERKMLDTIARRITLITLNIQREVSLMIDTLQRVDPAMLVRIGEKLRVHIKNNVDANVDILFEDGEVRREPSYGEINAPSSKPPAINATLLSKKMIAGATAFLREEEIFSLINGWIQEQRILALVKTVDSKYAGIDDILDAVRRYNAAMVENAPRPVQTETWLVAELAHRLLTNDNRLVDMVLDNIHISDFESMLERIIASGKSSGNIGGKGAGLFIAKQILKHAAREEPMLADIKTPRSWYLAADTIVDFLHYNSLEELSSYKYNTNLHLRMTYDNVVAKVKNAKLPPHVVQMLSVALDDMGDKSLVVRSSSLLEDRYDGAFSGKYKSLFLANQGTKKERLAALTNAILEVYSSMYNPDSIQYRRERGLLNFNEQMGVLIQEVVGRRIGRYFMPAFAGVAFSHNLLRWSPRIKRDSGLVRMVMGLGTRAVDRVSDDYPVLFSPGQPELRVNQTPSDIRHYSPKHIDLINLESGRFETVEADAFLREVGGQFPDLYKYVSVLNDDFIENRNMFTLDPANDDMIITFNSVMTRTEIPKKLKRMLDVLARKIDSPVDIEFAHDGTDMYLLQCRPQVGVTGGPAPIPKNLDPRDVLFTANRHISDGILRDITHIVYVDGDGYNALPTREALLDVGNVVGLLNDSLPRKKFILMGPGRWGSRGDIKLGVRVTYSDISGTAALIEIAKAKHSYVPELSFGTHFFQDLVEAGIVYVPLYPDQKGIVFQERFFMNSPNLLGEILPEFAWLSDVVKVIDVPKAANGRTFSLHMNSDLEQAVAFLCKPSAAARKPGSDTLALFEESQYDPRTGKVIHERCALGLGVGGAQEHWQWRDYMARQIAEHMDMDAFGVKGVYLLGASGSGEPGTESDIDLLLHVADGGEERRRLLEKWLDGWSRALAKANYLQTGYNADQLLDVHYVTDEDIANGTSLAVKIDSSVDPAMPLRLAIQVRPGIDPSVLRDSE